MLRGVQVLDLSRVLAGPWATQMLADLGATVIKVERAKLGDDTRHWGPPYNAQGLATYFTCANRGKESVSVDFKNQEQLMAVQELALNADVVVENFKVGQLKAFGLDATSLRAKKPSLIYCSITGYGQNGPRAHEAGYDFALQGLTGLMSITGPANGPPYKVGVAVIDIITGIYACNAITASLFHRTQTGEGATIDCALFDTGVALLANQGAAHLVAGAEPKAMGNTHPSIVPYQAYHAKDGYLVLAVGNDRQFASLAKALNQSHWAEDPRFITNPERVKNRDLLNGMLEPLLKTENRSHWLERFDAVGVPCTPVQNISEVFKELQLHERAMIVTHKQNTLIANEDFQSTKPENILQTVGQPMVINGLRPCHPLAPPSLGPTVSNRSKSQRE
jgi:crotonobetainyl-CoA:carnitine CoA-transferase CaiB-like acyl-CoA transferase